MPISSSTVTSSASGNSSRRSTGTCRCSTRRRAARPRRSPQRGIGDVLLSWENEAFLAINELGPDKFDIVVPPLSIKAEPPVALVVGNTEEKGTTAVAQAYLEYLYSPVGQQIIAKNYYRAAKPELADPQDLKRFPRLKLLTIDDPVFGGWAKVTPRHFASGGIFDQIFKR